MHYSIKHNGTTLRSKLTLRKAYEMFIQVFHENMKFKHLQLCEIQHSWKKSEAGQEVIVAREIVLLSALGSPRTDQRTPPRITA